MEETKRCPYCGEENPAAARSCKYCHEKFDFSFTHDIDWNAVPLKIFEAVGYFVGILAIGMIILAISLIVKFDGQANSEKTYAEAQAYYDAGEYQKAVTRLEKGFKKGCQSGQAYYLMGQLCEEGYVEDSCDDEDILRTETGSFEYYMKAAERNYVKAYYKVGKGYYDSNDIVSSLPYLEKGMDRDDIDACYLFGYILLQNPTTSFNVRHERPAFGGNVSVGIHWLTFAADKGHKDAQYVLGRYYQSRGNGPQSRKYYRMAAKQGHEDAKKELREMLVSGEEMIYE